MKLAELFNITEARDPDLKYTDKAIKGKVERVIVSLEAHQSGKFTKLARQYARFKKATEALAVKRDELNVKIKEEVEALFDAEDIIYNRMVETISLTMNISKKSEATTSKTDYEAIVNELLTLVPELTDQIEELKKTFTTSKTVEKSPALRVDLKEGLDLAGLKKLVKSVYSGIKSWATGYDRKLKSLQKRLEKI